MFTNYIKIQNIDFELNTILRMKINRRISSNLIAHFLYDDDLTGRLQIRSYLAGLTLIYKAFIIDETNLIGNNSEKY